MCNGPEVRFMTFVAIRQSG